MPESAPHVPRRDPPAFRHGAWIASNNELGSATTYKRFYLSSSFSLSPTSDGAGKETCLTHSSDQTIGTDAGIWCPYGSGPELPDDQQHTDEKCLTFDSKPLRKSLPVLGTTTLNLVLSVDRPLAFVVARLCDVSPLGHSRLVTWGALNLTHRESSENPKLLEPGRQYSVQIPLKDAAHVFPEQHRIRISISTTYWPTLWPSPEPGTCQPSEFNQSESLELYFGSDFFQWS